MTRPALALLTALALLLQAMAGLPPARAMANPEPVALCHTEPGTGPVPAGPPAPHDCLACPICAAAAAPSLLVPPPPELPPSSLVAVVVAPVPPATAPSYARTPANLPTGPPRLA